MTDPELAFSSPYALDTPVLVTRTGNTPQNAEQPKGLRLAMLYHYQPVEEVKPFIRMRMCSYTLLP